MGLIKMTLGAFKSTLADQVLEYFYCDKLPDDILLKKGMTRNTKETPQHNYGMTNNMTSNIISNGSIVAINEGQGILIVEDGKVIDFSMEQGAYRYDNSSEPSLFYGKFGQGLKQMFSNAGTRFTFGGTPGKDQRIYYINLRPILGGMFGSRTPVDYLDNGITLRLAVNGTYNLIISNPLIFYSKIAGNVIDEYRLSDNIILKLKSDIMSALSPALQTCSYDNVPYAMLLATSQDKITNAIKAKVEPYWGDALGIGINQINVEVITPIDDDNYAEYKAIQVKRQYNDVSLTNGGLNKSLQDRISGSHINENGEVVGATNGNGIGDAVSLLGAAMVGNMSQNQNIIPQFKASKETWKCAKCGKLCEDSFCSACGEPKPTISWICECGATSESNFCPNCGKKKPDAYGRQKENKLSVLEWTCSCGTVNETKFCGNCGKQKPIVKKYKCDKCGWMPKEGERISKFCPDCGDIINENDLVFDN